MGDVTRLRAFVFALFFFFGGITSLNDVLIPKLKGLFTLNYAEVMLVQSAFFAAYFCISLPAAALLRRIGYMASATVGLLLMMLGCLLFIPASRFGTFALFLAALFVLAAGITTVQVVANPLVAQLGEPQTASSRLTFAQAFNSLGTTIFPYFGAWLILSGASGDHDTVVIRHTYLGLAVALLILAVLVFASRSSLRETAAPAVPFRRAFGLLRQPRFAYGTLGIFLYVGAEVSIGSLIVSFLAQPGVMGLSAGQAGAHIPFYWGGAMVGRFIGAYVLKIIAPAKVLTGVAGIAVLLLLTAANAPGAVAGWALLAIGLCNSIMFPTIFSLACEGLGSRTAEGSGLLCCAIVGGAIVPLMTGRAADEWSLRLALAVPAVCYLGIMGFGWMSRRGLRASAA